MKTDNLGAIRPTATINAIHRFDKKSVRELPLGDVLKKYVWVDVAVTTLLDFEVK